MASESAPDWKSSQSQRLGEAAYSELKERLTRGGYQPGDKLTVRSVAQVLGVSSTPARDAINRLTAESALIYAGPKTVIIPHLSEDDLREVTLIRLALEGLAAEQAAPNCQPHHIETLLKIQTDINDSLEKKAYSQALWHNKEFHFLVYHLSGLPRLVSLIEAQWLRVGPSFYALYPEFAEARQGVRNHQMAIEALQDGDANALRAAFENDIRDGYRRLRTSLRSQPGA
ncbi:MAG: GntR family transcriptional regulator [Pseudorhizobium sp.]